MEDTINVVIGSWGSYNECNEKSLGSSWLDLSNYETWDEIEEELKKQGFNLKGIDEELFIQDIEGLPSSACNWDITNPKVLFETLKESSVLENKYQFELMQAYLEVRSYSDFETLVNDNESHWDDDIHFYKDYDWEAYGREYYESCGYKLPDSLENFIDFEAYGKYIGSCYAEEVSAGIIEICA
jgi:hypothetical protein